MDMLWNATPEHIERDIPMLSRVRVVCINPRLRYPSHLGARGVVIDSFQAVRGASCQWCVLLDGRKNGRYFFADELQILKE